MEDKELQTSNETQPEGEQEQSADEEVTSEPVVPEIDYKKKFSESTREAQIQAAKVKALEQRLGQLTNPDVSDDEMREVFSDWEDMSLSQQNLAKRNMILEKKLNAQQTYVAEMAFKEQQEQALKGVYARNPELRTRDDEFRAYISKKSHVGTPIDVLANAFLYEKGSTQNTKKASKGSVLETGRGDLGSRVPSTKKKNALSDAAREFAMRAGWDPDAVEDATA